MKLVKDVRLGNKEELINRMNHAVWEDDKID